MHKVSAVISSNRPVLYKRFEFLRKEDSKVDMTHGFVEFYKGSLSDEELSCFFNNKCSGYKKERSDFSLIAILGSPEVLKPNELFKHPLTNRGYKPDYNAEVGVLCIEMNPSLVVNKGVKHVKLDYELYLDNNKLEFKVVDGAGGNKVCLVSSDSLLHKKFGEFNNSEVKIVIKSIVKESDYFPG